MFGAKKNTNEAFHKFKNADKGRGKLTVKIIAAIVILLVLVAESYYSIQEEEQAVVCTFGSPKAVTTPGL